MYTGRWCEEEEVYNGAYETFAQASWDRTNGTINALSFNQLDLGYTFDESERANAECVADCIADALLNSLVPYMPPGVELHVFDGNSISLDWGSSFVFDWAPGGLKYWADYLLGQYQGWDEWEIRKGTFGEFPGLPAEKGINNRVRAKVIKNTGSALALISFVKKVFFDCHRDCANKPCGGPGSGSGSGSGGRPPRIVSN